MVIDLANLQPPSSLAPLGAGVGRKIARHWNSRSCPAFSRSTTSRA